MRHLAHPLLAALIAICSAACAKSVPLPDRNDFRAAAGPRLRVMTYNVKSCLGGPAEIARVIRQAAPDVVALQEVDDGTTRSNGVDQTRQLAELAGYAYYRHLPATRLYGGNYGLGILSRHPIESIEWRRLPVTGGLEPRILAHAVLQVGNHEISLYKTHLTAMPAHSRLRTEQARTIARIMRRDARPKLLVGDLNDDASSGTVRVFSARMVDTFAAAGRGRAGTLPLPLGLSFRYDYVFASRDFEVDGSWVLPSDASDHHPLVTDLTLASSPAEAREARAERAPMRRTRRF